MCGFAYHNINGKGSTFKLEVKYEKQCVRDPMSAQGELSHSFLIYFYPSPRFRLTWIYHRAVCLYVYTNPNIDTNIET